MVGIRFDKQGYLQSLYLRRSRVPPGEGSGDQGVWGVAFGGPGRQGRDGLGVRVEIREEELGPTLYNDGVDPRRNLVGPPPESGSPLVQGGEPGSTAQTT